MTSPHDPELPDLESSSFNLIAAQYVLGTLSVSARLRFQALLQDEPALRQLTYLWERRLSPLVNLLEPQPVPERVWQKIEATLNGVYPLPEPIIQPAITRKTPANDRFWKVWAWASTAIAASLALFVVWHPGTSVMTSTHTPVVAQQVRDIAVLSTDKNIPGWIVRQQGNTLILTHMNTPQVPADHDLELWAIHDHEAPRSLGVIRVQHGQAVMPLNDTTLVRANITLAISLEPRNGSPTGQPTGAVLYTGKVV